MKKNIIFTALALMSICMTGCSIESGSVQNNAATAPAVTEMTNVSQTTAAAQSTAVQTTAAQTTAAQTTAAQTTSAQTTAAQTAAAKITLDAASRLFGGYVATKDGANLNLRAQANDKADVLAKIPNGTQLNIYACDTKGWYLTEYQNNTGFVSADYIKEIETDAEGVPNAEGFYDANDLPATSVSVAALSGKWVNEQGDVSFTVSNGSDINHARFELIDQGGVTHTGNVQIQYLINQGGKREYCFTLYEDNGTFIYAFGMTDTIQLTDLYGYQSGDPHFHLAKN